MKYIIKSLMILIALFFVSGLSAQEIVVIEGKVVNEQGNPLVGVTVSVKQDNRKQTQTNAKGEFSLKAMSDQTIVVEYMSYETVELSAADFPKTPIVLKEDILSLDAVVVVGYGSVKKSDLTGAVGVVSVADMTKAPVMSVEDMLAGRVAGLQITSNSGQPGDEYNIVIRGGNSVTQDNSPLFVVDGMPMEGFDMGSLSPNDIESITVLKDASSTSIYGARGANGVIVITTKTGAIGSGIVYDGYASLSQVSKKIEVMSPYEFVKYQFEAFPQSNAWNTRKYLTDEGFTSIEDYKNVETVNWQDHLFRVAKSQTHNLNFRNNTEKGNYMMSGNFVRTEGVIINSGRDRNKVRATFNQSILKNLRFTGQLFYTNDRNWGSSIASPASDGTAYLSYVMARTWGYRPMNEGGYGNVLEELYDLGSDWEEGDEVHNSNMNPIITTKNEIRRQNRNTIFFNGNLEYRFAKGFEFVVRGGYVNKMVKNESFYNDKTLRGRISPDNVRGMNGGLGYRQIVDWSNEYLLSYKYVNGGHEIDAIGGVTFAGINLNNSSTSVQNVDQADYDIESMNYGIPGDFKIDKSKNTLMSYLARVNYNYKSKYLLTAAMRADGSSKFNPVNRWGYFPSGAVAYNLANEYFLADSETVNELKLRASYGLTGNNRVPDFAAEQFVDMGDFYSIESPKYFDRTLQLANEMGNDRLRWETTAQTDLGIDLALFNNRLMITADVYRKKTTDLILRSNLPLTSGYSQGYFNVGAVENKGLELSFNSVNVQTSNFLWTSNFNISFNRNKILALNVGEERILSGVNYAGTGWAAATYIAKVGQPIAEFYGKEWIGNYQYEHFDYIGGNYVLKPEIATNGDARDLIQPGDIRYKDQNGDGIVDNEDNIIMGSGLPKHFGGFQNNFSYKNLSLGIFFQWNYGNKIMNANRIFYEGNATSYQQMNQFATYVNRWTPDNQNNEYFRAYGEGPPNVYSTRTLEDGSYLRLRTVQLAFTFPKHWIKKITRIQMYVSGQNLFTWSNYSGLDPEVSIASRIPGGNSPVPVGTTGVSSTSTPVLTPGFDYSSYARSRVFAIGAKIEI